VVAGWDAKTTISALAAFICSTGSENVVSVIDEWVEPTTSKPAALAPGGMIADQVACECAKSASSPP
jgi:hypothetical protein